MDDGRHWEDLKPTAAPPHRSEPRAAPPPCSQRGEAASWDREGVDKRLLSTDILAAGKEPLEPSSFPPHGLANRPEVSRAALSVADLQPQVTARKAPLKPRGSCRELEGRPEPGIGFAGLMWMPPPMPCCSPVAVWSHHSASSMTISIPPAETAPRSPGSSDSPHDVPFVFYENTPTRRRRLSRCPETPLLVLWRRDHRVCQARDSHCGGEGGQGGGPRQDQGDGQGHLALCGPAGVWELRHRHVSAHIRHRLRGAAQRMHRRPIRPQGPRQRFLTKGHC